MSKIASLPIIYENDKPVSVIVPFEEYHRMVRAVNARKLDLNTCIPNEVVDFMILDNMTVIRAWRKYLKLTQKEVAARLGINQSAYAQIEKAAKNQRKTLKRVADALQISMKQLDFDD